MTRVTRGNKLTRTKIAKVACCNYRWVKDVAPFYVFHVTGVYLNHSTLRQPQQDAPHAQLILSKESK